MLKRACDHPACTCERPEDAMFRKEGRHYCCEACAEQPRHGSGCGCGHPECLSP